MIQQEVLKQCHVLDTINVNDTYIYVFDSSKVNVQQLNFLRATAENITKDYDFIIKFDVVLLCLKV